MIEFGGKDRGSALGWWMMVACVLFGAALPELIRWLI